MSADFLEGRFGPEKAAPSLDASFIGKPKGHRKRFEAHLRVPLGGSMISPRTSATIAQWRSKGLSTGLLHDQVYAFAKANGFVPQSPASTSKSHE